MWNGRICKQTIPSVGSSRSANCPRSLAARQVLRLFHPPSLHGNGRYPRCETLLSRQGTCVCCSEEGKHPVQSTWRVHPNQVRLHGRAMFTVIFYKVYVGAFGGEPKQTVEIVVLSAWANCSPTDGQLYDACRQSLSAIRMWFTMLAIHIQIFKILKYSGGGVNCWNQWQ